MFNLKFNTIDECKKANDMTDAQLCHALKQYFSNQNYRQEYNARKTVLNQLLKDDPVVKQRMAELKKSAK